MNGTSPLKDDVPGYYTYADYKAWNLAEGERYELIDGKPYAMSAPSLRHQEVSTLLAADFVNFFRGKPCKVYAAPFDVRLFYEEDESDDVVVQPDLSVICDKEKRGKDGCRGAPDLTVEILSPSNSVFEMSQKFNLYMQAGVREYWIVDPERQTVQCWHLEDRRRPAPTRYFTAEGAEGFPADTLPAGAVNGGSRAVSYIYPGLEIDLARLFEE